MGAWDVKIFQSDVALDVKEEFKAQLLIGEDGLGHGSILSWDFLLREIDYILSVIPEFYPKMLEKMGLKATGKGKGF